MKLVQRLVNVTLAMLILSVCVYSPVQARSRSYSSAISPTLLMLLAASQTAPPAASTPAGQQPQSSDAPTLPEGKGRDTTLRLCSNCHRIDRWDKQRHSPEQWSDIVDDMVGRGMDASDEDLATVNGYLSKYLASSTKTPTPQSQSDKPPEE
jgi:cytochrome c553